MTPDEIAALRQKSYNATVEYQRRPNPELMIVRVRPDFALPAHKPGQYSTLGLGNWEPRVPGCQEEHISEADEQRLVRRAYSIGCSVLDVAGVLKALKEVNFKGYISIEYEANENNPSPDVKECVAYLREAARKVS